MGGAELEESYGEFHNCRVTLERGGVLEFNYVKENGGGGDFQELLKVEYYNYCNFLDTFYVKGGKFGAHTAEKVGYSPFAEVFGGLEESMQKVIMNALPDRSRKLLVEGLASYDRKGNVIRDSNKA